MRVGSLVYATDQGLGLLAKSFYDAGVVTDVHIVEHAHRPTHHEWFPNASSSPIRRPDTAAIEALLSRVDVMLYFETPFYWAYVPKKRCAIMPMHECMPARMPALPNAFFCPSELDVSWAAQYPDVPRVVLPVPVEVEWKQRTTCEVFVHNAGHGGLHGRNGTRELLETWQYVKSPARLLVRSQKVVEADEQAGVEIVVGTLPYESMFTYGDAFIFPEKFNGLSLPLQEARAAGMLVVCGDRFPMNTWLPQEPLIPVKEYRRSRIGSGYSEYDEAVFDPAAIAAKVDQLYGTDITQYSLEGREWAQTMSWDALKSRYLDALSALCK